MADEPEQDPSNPTPVAAVEAPAPDPSDSRLRAIEQQIQGLTTVMASAVARPAPAPPPRPAGDDVSDDELFQRAQQGDKGAFETWTERRADKRVNQRLAAARHEAMIDQQLMQYGQQYPVFQDVNHPLTVAARNKTAMMIAEGYGNNKATLLAAMEKTIASNPQITAQIYSGPAVAADQQRRASAAGASAGHFAPSHRAPSSRGPSSRVKEPTPDEWALARRMGVRDPKGAKERFLQRQADGRSSLGAVANFVREEDL